MIFACGIIELRKTKQGKKERQVSKMKKLILATVIFLTLLIPQANAMSTSTQNPNDIYGCDQAGNKLSGTTVYRNEIFAMYATSLINKAMGDTQDVELVISTHSFEDPEIKACALVNLDNKTTKIVYASRPESFKKFFGIVMHELGHHHYYKNDTDANVYFHHMYGHIYDNYSKNTWKTSISEDYAETFRVYHIQNTFGSTTFKKTNNVHIPSGAVYGFLKEELKWTQNVGTDMIG